MNKKKKSIKSRVRVSIRIFCGLSFLICGWVLSVVINLSQHIPNQFSVTEGTTLQLEGAVQASAPLDQSEQAIEAVSLSAGNHYTVSLKLFGLIPIKDVLVAVVETPVVVPCGTPFGIKLFSDGVTVVETHNVTTTNGVCNPAQDAGIQKGDLILSINGEAVVQAEQVLEIVAQAEGKPLSFRILRDDTTFDTCMIPAKSICEDSWKSGLEVCSSTSGLGTMTFYNPSNHTFGGLGHAVTVAEEAFAATGEIVPAQINGIKKGIKGVPGTLQGSFSFGSLGSLTVNDETGVFGILDRLPDVIGTVPVCMKQEVKVGEAQLLTTIDGNKSQLFDIRIDQVSYNDSSQTHNMIITVTDPYLLQKTGGIVQGMSGSPILQDGKLAGAISHVFIENPSKGYAIFAENMLETSNTVTSMENVS